MPDSSGNEFVCESKAPQLGLLIQNYNNSNAISVLKKKKKRTSTPSFSTMSSF